MVSIPGFASAGYGFDVLAVPRRDVLSHDVNEFPALAAVPTVVFPAFACAFSGTETVDDAVYRVNRALLIGRLSRDPVPFLKMRYRNDALAFAHACVYGT
ncbi:hypothetical protein AB0F72_40520 [Actinoplanes sp. NPDC023936]|uniref:hypothetical protein n=1 Tax=Actinoplanes sp. NPDC023936 TaxID=3154910 RepID=UPI0033CA9EB8